MARWVKGQSGNSKGRPKSETAIAELARAKWRSTNWSRSSAALDPAATNSVKWTWTSSCGRFSCCFPTVTALHERKMGWNR